MHSLPAPGKRPFTWVEAIALPVAVSVMEAQPLALVLSLGTVILTRSAMAVPLTASDLTLLALSLLWWGMIMEAGRQRRASQRILLAAQLGGWGLALVVLVLMQRPGIPVVLVDLVLVTWLWQRGLRRAQTRLDYEDLQASFKVGIAAIVMIVLLVALNPTLAPLDAPLSVAVPVFFSAGLLTISLARLGTIRDARHQLDGPQADPTRIWLVALAVLCLGMIAAAFLIETVVSLATLRQGLGLLAPLWNILGVAANWLLFAIAFVLGGLIDLLVWLINGLLALFGHISGQGASHPTVPSPPLPASPAQPPTSQHPSTSGGFPPVFVTILQWLLIVALGWAMIAALLRGLRRWFALGAGAGVEEVRESLAHDNIRHHRQRATSGEASATPPWAPLDPTSVRALYRALLEAAADAGAETTRRLDETPTEYARRLTTLLRQPTTDAAEIDRIVGELTHAYQAERYSGISSGENRRAQARDWVVRLIALLTPAPAPPRRRRP